MNKNFENIIWFCGHFGVMIREHAEKLIYRGKYGYISANRTLSKLEKEYGYLKRIDRGKRKTDGYKLTNKGVSYFKKHFGYEPKVFNSGDKLMHSIQIANFYTYLWQDYNNRYDKKNHIIIEEINFKVQKPLQFKFENKEKVIIPDAFCIYRYLNNRGIAFFLEIENSNRNSANIANKTIKNYEGYFISEKWKYEKWQPKNKKIFPLVLIVTYSDWKMRELIRHFNKKRQIKINYLFKDYKSLKEEGISGYWTNLNNEKIKLISN